MSAEHEAVVVAFNAAINRRDLSALARLMDEGNRFIDKLGNSVDGKPACVKAWRGFFDTFPDYKNIFDDLESTRDGVVTARGRSECTAPDLVGPASWRAVVLRGLVLEWQVSDDLTRA